MRLRLVEPRYLLLELLHTVADLALEILPAQDAAQRATSGCNGAVEIWYQRRAANTPPRDRLAAAISGSATS